MERSFSTREREREREREKKNAAASSSVGPIASGAKGSFICLIQFGLSGVFNAVFRSEFAELFEYRSVCWFWM